MTMKPFFKELLEYNHQHNQKLADVFVQEPAKTSDKAFKVFNHILNAQQVWNNRISNQERIVGVWELHKVKDLKSIDLKNYRLSLRILDKFDLNEKIQYKNSKGRSYTNSVKDICFHIINHSSYHRGQIASEFRKQGLEPLVTDYIDYKRNLPG